MVCGRGFDSPQLHQAPDDDGRPRVAVAIFDAPTVFELARYLEQKHSAGVAHLLGTPIPADVLAALAPPAWKRDLVMRWLRRADFFEPDAKKFSRPGMMAFHALLYDDAAGLAASAMGTDRAHLGLRHLPGNLARGARRVFDLATRYQR